MQKLTKHNPGLQKKAFGIKAAILLILCLLGILIIKDTAKAEYYNLGSLDVQPIFREGATNHSWFTEFLKPNQSLQEQLRISNFSTSPKNLEIYVADSVSEQESDTSINTNFFVQSQSEQQDDINNWTRLPIQKLDLAPGESKIISVNIALPKNAGVGLHKGAIIVREKTADNVYMEKGVRIYLNVIGPAITLAKTNGLKIKESAGNIVLQLTTQNLGTTDYKTKAELELKPLFGEGIKSEKKQDKVRPQTTVLTEASIEKPAYGIYQINATINGDSATIGTIIILPFWGVFFVFFTALAFAKPRFKIRKINFSKIKQELSLVPELVIGFIKEFQLAKSVSYFGLFALVATSTIYLSGYNLGEIKTQILKPKAGDSYDLEVKWGNFRNLTLPPTLKQSWKGEISVTDGTLSTKNLIDFERNDTAQTADNSHTLKFNLETGRDSDGILLKITPNSEITPKITYINSKTKEQVVFSIADYLNSSGVIANGLFGVQFKTTYSPDNASPNLAQELNATNEANSTPEATADIPELKNLFIEDLPATPEVLADFVLTSDYVEKISNDNKTAQIKTDPILIEALSATPEVLREIASTPELNYIFIPSDPVHFPPQEFSFDKKNISSQNMGTLIFVNNKDVPWNTYVKTTDFTSLSKKVTIPANALTIIPGQAEVLNKDGNGTIVTGNAKTFSSTSDKSVLVDIKPNSDNNTLFELNPVLEIRIPAGTLPGRYQGTLTITSL